MEAELAGKSVPREIKALLSNQRVFLRETRCALHALVGIARFPGDDPMRNLFRRFRMGGVHWLFDAPAERRMERLPEQEGGYTLDFTCGAMPGRAGRRLVLYLSQSWGGLKTRNPLFDSILQ